MAEHYKGHKPGSRKGIVHQVFDNKGEKAALAIASEMGLAASTARSWIGTWSKGEEPKPQPVKGKTAPAPVISRAKMLSKGGKVRVHMVGHPDYLGTLLVEGDEQSEIRWDNGNVTSAVVNSWFVKLPGELNGPDQ